ncbi:IS66 family transposase [Microcoleus sp. AT13-A5]|uniref:IS66 family transposase n=1 Tax=Microcoleus sp. AT13-A5 TaxID=2818590 RepID=UPI004040BCCE
MLFYLLLKSLRDKAEQWWYFLNDPSLPPDNNLAERSLRLAVTKRKVSGGSRSMKGFEETADLLSVIQTCRFQARSVMTFFREALYAHSCDLTMPLAHSPFSDLNPYLKSQISNLKSPISNLKSQISNLQSPISNLKSPISNLKSPISNLKSQISNLKSQISNLKSQILSPHLARGGLTLGSLKC